MFVRIIFLAVLLTFSTNIYAYKANVNDVPIIEFMELVSEFTGKNFVYRESDIKGNITITSKTDMDGDALLDILYSTLKSLSIVPVDYGNYVELVTERQIGRSTPRSVASDEISGLDAGSYVVSVIVLENHSAPMVATPLNKIKSPYGVIDAVKGTNALVIRETKERLEEMHTLISIFDEKAGDLGIYVVTLENASASQVQQHVSKLYADLIRDGLGSRAPALVSDQASNTIVMVVSADEYEKINYIIKKLDSATSSAGGATRAYYMKYAVAEDVYNVINSVLGSGSSSTDGAAAPNSVADGLSSVAFDKATNSIIAVGDQELYSKLEELINKIDIPRKQVYVEALFMETNADDGLAFGVEWSVGGLIGDEYVGFGSNMSSDSSLGALQSSIAAGEDSTGIALPSGFSAGVIGNMITYNGVTFPGISALISATSTDSNYEIISSPQILTLDNEEAEIFVGENRPFLTSERTDSNNNTIQSYDYKDVGVNLKVTPHITGDDSVTLVIDKEVKQVASTAISQSAPITLTRKTVTTVRLQDGGIMVISGLMRNDSNNTITGIPFLQSIPFLGILFRTETTSYIKTNMTVFLSVKIIDSIADAEAIALQRGVDSREYNEYIYGDFFNTGESPFGPMSKELEKIEETLKQGDDTEAVEEE